jgi:hypothetical protein
VATTTLELFARFDAWHAGAWHAAWNGRPVTVVIGPVARGASSLALSVEAAGPVLGLQEEGVLELLDVATHDGRLAWVYEPFPGVSLGALRALAIVDALPLRVGVEIVARVADILGRTSATIEHRGPDRLDVLLDARGRVVLAGFVGPWRPSGGLVVPGSEHGERSAVYRLGALLGDVVAGASPSPIEDPEAQAAQLRRILAHLEEFHPGPESRVVGQILARMLSWDDAVRPGLAEVSTLLRGAVTATRPTLGEWASAQVPRLQEMVRDRAERVRGEPTPVAPPPDPDGDGDTAPGGVAPIRVEEPVEDEPTHVAQDADPSNRPPMPPTLPPASIPVQVGPPAEVVKRAPKLPKGFLEEETGDLSTAAMRVVQASVPPLLLGLAVSFAALVLIVGVLASLLIRGERPLLPDAQVSEALHTPPPPTTFDVVFYVRGGEPFTIRCAGDVAVSGEDGATVRGVLPGRCVVRGRIDGQDVEASVDVSGPGEVRCFQTRQAVCGVTPW